MILYAYPLYLASILMCLVGLGLMVTSLVQVSRRGVSLPMRFWAPRELFVGSELALNRSGFWLCMAGLATCLIALALIFI